MYGMPTIWRVALAFFMVFVWMNGQGSSGTANAFTSARSEAEIGSEDGIEAGTPGTGKLPESGIREGGETRIQKESGPKVEHEAAGEHQFEEGAPGIGKIPESGFSEDGKTTEGDVEQETVRGYREGTTGTGKIPESGISEDGKTPVDKTD